MWRSVGVDTVECTLSCSERFWKKVKKHSHGFISFAVYNSVSYKAAPVMSRSPIRLSPLSREKYMDPFSWEKIDGHVTVAIGIVT